MILDKYQLEHVTGGSINWTAISVVGTIITFIAGIIDGYLRPIKCGK